MDLISGSVDATWSRSATAPPTLVFSEPKSYIPFAQLLMMTKEQIPRTGTQLDYSGTFTVAFHIDAAKEGSLFVQNLLEDIVNVSMGVLSVRKRQDIRRRMQCDIEEKTADDGSNVHTVWVNVYTDAPDRLYRALDCIKIKRYSIQ